MGAGSDQHKSLCSRCLKLGEINFVPRIQKGRVANRSAGLSDVRGASRITTGTEMGCEERGTSGEDNCKS